MGYESVKHLEVLQAPMTAGHLDSSRHPGRDDSGAKDVLTKERQGFLLSPGISLKWFAAMPTKEKERERERQSCKKTKLLCFGPGGSLSCPTCAGDRLARRFLHLCQISYWKPWQDRLSFSSGSAIAKGLPFCICWKGGFVEGIHQP